MKRMLLIGLLLTMLLTAGCYDVELRVQVFENGQGSIDHTVILAKAMYQMRLAAKELTDQKALASLRSLAATDAAATGGLQIAEVKIANVGGNVHLVRRFLFDDAQAMNRYFSLLGIQTDLKVKKTFFCRRVKGFDFTAKAATLDIQQLTRIGDFYEAQQQEGAMPGVASPDHLSLVVALPGETGQVEPDTRRERGAVFWTVSSEQFAQPHSFTLAAKLPKRKPQDVQTQLPFDVGAVLRPALAASPDEAVKLLSRLGSRAVPVLHVRLDKQRRADLALLWAPDEVLADAAAYHAQLDAMLFPDLTTNYYRWMEVVTVNDEQRLATGYRTRKPLKADQLTGALRIEKTESGAAVSFTPPPINWPAGVEPPDYPALLLIATFPGGGQQQRVVTYAQLRQGSKITVAAPPVSE